MPRAPRIIYPDCCYHYFPRGSRRSPVFKDRHDYTKYKSLVLAAKIKFDVKIRHYVLMPNHVHFMLEPSTSEIAGFAKYIQGGYAVYFCKKYGLSGNVWQQHGKSKLITDDDYFLTCGIYIEMNPVRAGITTRPELWANSSYRHYACGVQDPIVDDSQFYEGLGDSAEIRQKLYRQLVESVGFKKGSDPFKFGKNKRK